MKKKILNGLLVLLLVVVFQTVVSGYNISPNSQRAIEIADNIIAWQTDAGGWTKNEDFTRVMWQPGMSRGALDQYGREVGTFDNSASIDEMRFLKRVYNATGLDRFKDSFLKGFEWMLEAQYPSGGWPQVYPLRNGYWDYVTFNDSAMQRVMTFIQEIIANPELYSFLDESDFVRLQVAFDQGIDYILESQIEVNGYLTAWCQQHDPVTYEPRMGRSYEHPSITPAESVPIVQLLMSLEDPSEEVRRAILSALEWFDVSMQPNDSWGRFHEIGTNLPIYSGRDSIIRYFVDDIEAERQRGYSWGGTWPRAILAEAKASGYMDELRASLPDHQSLTYDVFGDYAVPRFNMPRPLPTTTATGDLPVNIRIVMHDVNKFKEIVLKINDQVIHRSDQSQIAFDFDTRKLENGLHQLTAETTTTEGRNLSHSVAFMVDNPVGVLEIPLVYFEIDNGTIVFDDTSTTGVAIWVDSYDFEATKTTRLHPGTYTVETWMKISTAHVNELGRSHEHSDAIELTVDDTHIRTYYNADFGGDYGTNLDRVLTFTLEEEKDIQIKIFATDEIGMLLDKIVIRKL